MIWPHCTLRNLWWVFSVRSTITPFVLLQLILRLWGCRSPSFVEDLAYDECCTRQKQEEFRTLASVTSLDFVRRGMYQKCFHICFTPPSPWTTNRGRTDLYGIDSWDDYHCSYSTGYVNYRNVFYPWPLLANKVEGMLIECLISRSWLILIQVLWRLLGVGYYIISWINRNQMVGTY